MSKAISVRLDQDAERALARLQRTGLTQSEAIRSALIAASKRLWTAESLAAEIAAADQDPADRAEMAAVAELMEALRGPG